VIELDPAARTARVLPGTVLDDLRAAAAPHGLTFGPDPATHAWCTLGGMIGNNACGVHSLTAGRTSDNVEALEILTYDGLRLRVGATPEEELARLIRSGGRRGEIYRHLRELRDRHAEAIRARFPRLPRRVSGFNLDELLPENGFHVARALTGTEGTCVTILEATLRLVPRPAAKVLLILGYPDVFAAADHVLEVLAAEPAGLEGMDRFLVENDFTRRAHQAVLDTLPDGGAWLLAEFAAATPDEAAARARSLLQSLQGHPGAPGFLLLTEPADQARFWAVREAAVGTTSHDPRLGEAWPGWEDAAVPPARLASYLRAFKALLARFGYGAALYGHFGEGCLHARINFDLRTPDGVRRHRAFMEEAADLVVAHGGSLSGEHGDGQARGELLERMFGPELVTAFRDFKAIWDPDGRMNPGKVIDPYPLDSHLRPRTPLAALPTHLHWPEDGDRYARAVQRCVGVGRCRRDDGGGAGVMCPSWRATREEKHSTRGRSRLLFEMLAGEVVTAGWHSEEVREALDLCLACKGCKHDCPAGVDMAALKAEFLAHFYRDRLRPLRAYAAGWIHRWARLASLAPDLANAILQSPPAAWLQQLAGIAPERTLPAFARTTFRSRFLPRGAGPAVLLWPDTFTNHFQPEIAEAAVDVLAAAGRRVEIPHKPLCCGRPLYDFGMLDQARRQLREILDALSPSLAAGVPLVVLEPSCAAVFRDEALQLFPADPRARLLAERTFTLAGFLTGEARFLPPVGAPTPGPVLVQPHCHQHTVLGTAPDRELLAHLGLAPQWLEGCCGMAGAFGFAREHFAISQAVGEQNLLPALRAAGPESLVLADGFSCREQIRQSGGRRALHLAEVVRRALPSF
ncbi:MAG TPA: FAD-binding oxidoreductase, partial [Acidobacteria bacterium]|nr:FAD-binding oxidoreductase [Acidobacteriota bacterium]